MSDLNGRPWVLKTNPTSLLLKQTQLGKSLVRCHIKSSVNRLENNGRSHWRNVWCERSVGELPLRDRKPVGLYVLAAVVFRPPDVGEPRTGDHRQFGSTIHSAFTG